MWVEEKASASRMVQWLDRASACAMAWVEVSAVLRAAVSETASVVRSEIRSGVKISSAAQWDSESVYVTAKTMVEVSAAGLGERWALRSAAGKVNPESQGIYMTIP